MPYSFDYYYSRESEQFSFFRIPKALFTDPIFRDLSVEAKLLYGMMLDRMALSKQSGWVDGQGHVYIYFVYTDIQEQLGCGHNKATKHLKELDDFGLIHRKRQGLGKPDRIYVMNFVTGREISPNEDIQTSENGSSGLPENGVQDLPKEVSIKTDTIKTDMSKTDIFYPPPPRSGGILPDDTAGVRKMLREKWGYISLIDSHPRETIENLILLGTDILCTKKATVRVGGEEMPTQRVQERLLSLDMTHIDYVLETFNKTTVHIHNVRAYLLTALYNAPTTIDAYYTALFRKNEARN